MSYEYHDANHEHIMQMPWQTHKLKHEGLN